MGGLGRLRKQAKKHGPLLHGERDVQVTANPLGNGSQTFTRPIEIGNVTASQGKEERTTRLLLAGIYRFNPLSPKQHPHRGRICRTTFFLSPEKGVPVVWEDTGATGQVDGADLELVREPTPEETEAALADQRPEVRKAMLMFSKMPS